MGCRFTRELFPFDDFGDPRPSLERLRRELAIADGEVRDLEKRAARAIKTGSLERGSLLGDLGEARIRQEQAKRRLRERENAAP